MDSDLGIVCFCGFILCWRKCLWEGECIGMGIIILALIAWIEGNLLFYLWMIFGVNVVSLLRSNLLYIMDEKELIISTIASFPDLDMPVIAKKLNVSLRTLRKRMNIYGIVSARKRGRRLKPLSLVLSLCSILLCNIFLIMGLHK